MQEPNIPIPSPTDYRPANSTMMGVNDSGTGATAVLPAEIKGFNWGAFFLNWIWSIGHSSWIGLLSLVPYLGFIMAIVLGFKGNEWAWQNRKWDSVEHFKKVQKIWATWGLVLFVLSIVFSVLILIPVFNQARETARNQSAIQQGLRQAPLGQVPPQ